MTATAEKSDPKLWDKVKHRVTEGKKGGKPGQWSARKAQLAVAEYKHEGGDYRGRKSADNHLAQWTEEDWGTRSGRPSGETGERYLPKKARKALSLKQYSRTTAKKRADSQKGKQFSSQPKDVADRTAHYRETGYRSDKATPTTRASLYAKAKQRGIAGRSTMTKAQLAAALHAR